MPAPGIHGWREHESPPHVFKDTSKKDLVTRDGRLGGCRYNQFSLKVESVYSDYLRVAILGNDINCFPEKQSARFGFRIRMSRFTSHCHVLCLPCGVLHAIYTYIMYTKYKLQTVWEKDICLPPRATIYCSIALSQGARGGGVVRFQHIFTRYVHDLAIQNCTF
jgi:hypothetical protein